jgi:hypothetical protein
MQNNRTKKIMLVYPQYFKTYLQKNNSINYFDFFLYISFNRIIKQAL